MIKTQIDRLDNGGIQVTHRCSWDGFCANWRHARVLITAGVRVGLFGAVEIEIRTNGLKLDKRLTRGKA